MSKQLDTWQFAPIVPSEVLMRILDKLPCGTILEVGRLLLGSGRATHFFTKMQDAHDPKLWWLHDDSGVDGEVREWNIEEWLEQEKPYQWWIEQIIFNP